MVMDLVCCEQQLQSVFGSAAEESLHTKTQQALPNAVSWLVSSEKIFAPETLKCNHFPPLFNHLEAGQ